MENGRPDGLEGPVDVAVGHVLAARQRYVLGGGFRFWKGVGLSTQPLNFNVNHVEVERLSSQIGVGAMGQNFDEIKVE